MRSEALHGDGAAINLRVEVCELYPDLPLVGERSKGGAFRAFEQVGAGAGRAC